LARAAPHRPPTMQGLAPSRVAPRRRGVLGLLAASAASVAALRWLLSSGSAGSAAAFLSGVGLSSGGDAIDGDYAAGNARTSPARRAPAAVMGGPHQQQAGAAGFITEEARATRRELLAAGAAAGLLVQGAEEVRADFGKAGCTMKVSFPEASCDAVLQLAKSRASGENGWLDPHNRGTYKVTDASPTELQGTRVTGLKGGPSMGGPFTDKWNLKFAASPSGGCAVSAASTSTGFSILDASTNYCNLHNLYASPDWKFAETFESCNEHDTVSCGPGDVMKR